MEGFTGRRGQKKEDSGKEWVVLGSHIPLGEEGVCQADGLTSADQVVPRWLVKGDVFGRDQSCS